MTEESSASLDIVFARAPHVVARNIGGEFVLVPIVAHGADLEAIFHLNRVGSFIWDSLDGRKCGGQIVREVMDRFEVDLDRADADYRQFLAQLESIRVVTHAKIAGGAAADEPPP